MPRWIAIRASAVVALVGSVLTLLFAVLLALVLLGGGRLGETGPLPPQVVKVILAAGILVLAGLSFWGISTAAGVFQRCAWARVSMVIFAGMLLFFGATGVPAMLLLPSAYNSPGGAEGVWRGMAGFYLMLAALGAWWLILFNREASRKYFANGAANPRPLSITIIAGFLLAAGAFSALAAVMRAPFAFLGFSAGDWTAVACYTGAAAFQIYLGSSLLELNRAAWGWSIAFFAALAANAAGTAALEPPGAMTEALAEAYERRFLREAPALPDEWTLVAAGIAIAILPIWFLVRRRKAFHSAGPAAR